MPSSPIRKLFAHASEARKQGVTVYELNIGQPDLNSPAEFWDVLRDTPETYLAYTPSGGIDSLREAVAQDYRNRGIDVWADEVLITNGGSEACLFAFLSCFDPGDEVIVVEPFYANYNGFAVAAGITLKPITTYLEDDFALPATEVFAAQLTPRTRGILLCNPSNPTGTVYAPEQLRAIAELAREHDLFLMVDEVYRDFYYGEEDLLSVLQIPGLEEHAVMIDSASKKFSLCGARIGFLVSRNRELLAGALKYGQARLSVPTLEQAGVEHCLRHTGREYFEETRREYIARRDQLVRDLSEIPGVRVPKIEGAFYAVVRLPVSDADAFCEWLIRDFRYENQTVLLAPASGFYATPGAGRDEVRIAYVLDRERLGAAVTVLAAALAEWDRGAGN